MKDTYDEGRVDPEILAAGSLAIYTSARMAYGLLVISQYL